MPYGVDIYGSSVYGVAPIPTTLPLLATPILYGNVSVNWATPTGTYDRVRLLRSSDGIPGYFNDGVTLYDGATSPNFYYDFNLRPGYFYYYGLFIRTNTATNTWTFVAGDQVLIPQDFDYRDRLWYLLPSMYRDMEYENFGINGPLQRFLNLLGYSLDNIRSEIDALKFHNNIDRIDTTRIQALSGQFGTPNETGISEGTNRIRTRNSVYLHKTKGTQQSVVDAAKSITGFGVIAVPTLPVNASIPFVPHNFALLPADGLTLNDAGSWRVVSNCTITPVSTNSPFTGTYHLKVTPVGAGDVVIQNYDSSTPLSIKQTCINALDPLLANDYTAYLSNSNNVGVLASIRSKSDPSGSNRAVSLILQFYDIDGRSLGSFTGTPLTDSTIYVAGPRPSVQAAGISAGNVYPAGTKYVGVQVKRAATAGAIDINYYNTFQIEPGNGSSTSPTTWLSPRAVQLFLNPPQKNMMRNPSDEGSDSGWTGTNSATQFKFGVKSNRITASPGPANIGAIVTGGQVLYDNSSGAGNQFTVSAYVYPDAGTYLFQFQIQWDSTDGGSVRLYPNTGFTSDLLTAPAGQWTRLSQTVVCPTIYSGKLIANAQILISGTPSPSWYIDGGMFNKGRLLDYFDGSFATLYTSSDYYWYGSANLSQSAYYPNLNVKMNRLAIELPAYLPNGVQYYTYLAGQGSNTNGQFNF